MCGDDGHRAWRDIDVVERSVFFDGQFQDRRLGFDCMRIFANVLTRDNVLCDAERWDRHADGPCEDQRQRYVVG